MPLFETLSASLICPGENGLVGRIRLQEFTAHDTMVEKLRKAGNCDRIGGEVLASDLMPPVPLLLPGSYSEFAGKPCKAPVNLG